MKIKEIKTEVESAVQEAYALAKQGSMENYYLLLGRGDTGKVEGKNILVVDNNVDWLKDHTRGEFYTKYLNANYHREGFFYNDDNGEFCLNIEMLIYLQCWESIHFLKSMAKLAVVCNQDAYDWDLRVPDQEIRQFIMNRIVAPMKKNNLKIGALIENSYSSYLRNSVAHSLYSIDADNKQIHLYSNNTNWTLSFEDFQTKFLYSIILSNYMHNYHEQLRREFAVANQGKIFEIRIPNGSSRKMTVDVVADFRSRFFCVGE